MNRSIVLFATVALLGLAACGDSSTSSASTTNSAAGSAASDPAANIVVAETGGDDTVVEETVVDESVVGDTADPNAPGFGTEFCDISDELNANAFDPFQAAPAEVEEFFSVSFPKLFDRLSKAAPAELDDDITKVGDAYAVLITDLKSNGWDMNASFANPKVQEVMTGDDLSTAGSKLDAYCGI